MKKEFTFLVVSIVVAVTFGVLLLFYVNNSSSDLQADDLPLETQNQTNDMNISSPAFKSNDTIPSKYTCDGDNIHPPLDFENIPEGTVSLVLTMHDPDVPKEIRQDGNWDHWLVYNIAPDINSIEEGLDIPAKFGNNSSGNTAYTGPCPPTQYKPTTHRYIFTLYALDATLNLPDGVSRAELEEALAGSVIDKDELIGVYDRSM